jgi:hypothetical protein
MANNVSIDGRHDADSSRTANAAKPEVPDQALHQRGIGGAPVSRVTEVSENLMRLISFPVCFKSRRSEEIEGCGTHAKTTDFTDFTD